MITRIALKNFKAFRDEEINLTSLNLFTGLNGMGKSTFIQSLLLLRQSEAHLASQTRGLVLKGGEKGMIDIGKGKDAYSMHADSDFISFEIDYKYSPFLNNSYEYIAESDVLPIAKAKIQNYQLPDELYPPLFNKKFIYLKAERITPEHNYKANLYDVLQNRFLGYKGENVPLYIALKKLEPVTLPSIKHPNAKADNLISNLDAWLNEITPGAHVISTYFNELDIVKLGYQFDNGSDFTPEFSPVNVGFGFTYTLPVILAILAAEKGDLVIIENPESHLHRKPSSKCVLFG